MFNKPDKNYLKIKEYIDQEKKTGLHKLEKSGLKSVILNKIKNQPPKVKQSRFFFSRRVLTFCSLLLIFTAGYIFTPFIFKQKKEKPVNTIKIVLNLVLKQQRKVNQKKPEQISAFEWSVRQVLSSVNRKKLNFLELPLQFSQVLVKASNNRINRFFVKSTHDPDWQSMHDRLEILTVKGNYYNLFFEIIKKIKEV